MPGEFLYKLEGKREDEEFVVIHREHIRIFLTDLIRYIGNDPSINKNTLGGNCPSVIEKIQLLCEKAYGWDADFSENGNLVELSCCCAGSIGEHFSRSWNVFLNELMCSWLGEGEKLCEYKNKELIRYWKIVNSRFGKGIYVKPQAEIKQMALPLTNGTSSVDGVYIWGGSTFGATTNSGYFTGKYFEPIDSWYYIDNRRYNK